MLNHTIIIYIRVYLFASANASMDRDKIVEKTMDIIKKYYKHSEEYPVLKHTSPEKLKKDIDLRISKKGTDMESLFSEMEKIAFNSPKTNSR